MLDLMDYAYAIESYNDFTHYGLPYEGGSQDMPYTWKIAVDCINEALAMAKVEAMADAKDIADAREQKKNRA